MTTTPHLPAGLDRELMAMRLAAALRDVDARYVNIGLPTLVSNFIPAVADVILHAENGMLNYGPLADLHEQDVDYRNAGGQFITLLPGAAFMDSSLSFALIRSGRLDVTILGGYQVSGNGDLANWMRPVRGIGSIGGAMDLVYGTKQVFVGMEHTTRTGEARHHRDGAHHEGRRSQDPRALHAAVDRPQGGADDRH